MKRPNCQRLLAYTSLLFPISLVAFRTNTIFLRPPTITTSNRVRVAFLRSSQEVEFQIDSCQDDNDNNNDDDENRRVQQRFYLEDDLSNTVQWNDDPFDVVRYFTETAIQHRGQPECLEALEVLSELCNERHPFRFEEYGKEIVNSTTTSTTSSSSNPKSGGSLVSKIKKLLPTNVISAFLEEVQRIENNGWMSTNLDSVDGLPSLHVNLVSGGKPLVSRKVNKNNNDDDDDDDDDDENTDEDLNDFQHGILKLLSIIEPYIYDNLLPEVNKLLNTTSIQVSDIFLRRYGQDICGSMSRNGLSAHYDVLSRVTSVIALDDVAALGTNGLFTTYMSSSSSSSSKHDTSGKTSNHASLRRFFPLGKGDAVVHTWDVLHGVDVESGLDRTSLIVWFTTEEQRQQEEHQKKKKVQEDGTNNDDATLVGSWLVNHPKLDVDDVAQFVLATALSCQTSSEEEDSTITEKQHRLYLKSAAQGNTFALNSMGCICEEGSISSETTIEEEALKVLESLRPLALLPDPIRCSHSGDSDTEESIRRRTEMARRFWFEGSVRGNPLAQEALANNLMYHASFSDSSGENVEDSRLLAAVLFALAGQQGKEDAMESLSRVIEIDLSSRQIESQEDFLASPVVQIAQASVI